MTPRLLPKQATDDVLQDVRNLWKHLVGGGIADLSRMPSTVIGERPKAVLHRYEPTTPTDPDALPILIVPPLAASAITFDLRRGCSVVEYLLEIGRPVYLVDYGDVSSRHDSDLGLEFWIDEVLPYAIEQVSADSGGRAVHLLGWCLGGIMGMYTEAAHPDLPVASIATVASPFDFREVRLLEPLRILEDLTRGAATTTLVRVLGGIPGKANSLVFKWMSPDKQLKKPITVFKNRSRPEVLAQIEAVDAVMDSMEAYPGRSMGQLYHSFIRTNRFSDGQLFLREGRVVELATVGVPVLSIAGTGDLLLCPPRSAYRLGELLPNAPHLRLETAPGGHLGVLTGSRARGTTWRYVTEFFDQVDAERAQPPDSTEEPVDVEDAG